MANMKVLLPQFGMGMQDGEIVRWLKAVGDKVEQGEPLLEVEAAKTTVEVPSPGTGTLTEIVAEEGETVDVRAHIATIAV
ncbi:biotin/lipoyl-containing protein [Sphingomonas sp. 1P06PA]|uniref:biotin/lipoyl-containing protein n=1 Tax=Sphingomonas sp. 1P06PA TaxID=554121 RepID=UPI0039A497A5